VASGRRKSDRRNEGSTIPRDDSRLRILVVSSLFYPHVGGAERQARALAKALRERGADVLILTHTLKGAERWTTIDGTPVYRGIRAVGLGPLWGLTYMLSTLWAITGLRTRYDLIHCQQLYLHAPIAVCCQWWLKKPVVVRLACTRAYGDIAVMRKLRFGRLLLMVAGRARRFVALSREGQLEAQSMGVPPGNITIIPNAVLLSDMLSGLSSPGSENMLLFVGSLRKHKGLDHLLEAFAQLEGRWHLYLVGNGPQRSHLERRAIGLNIGARVHFVGQLEDPSAYYARARLFVLPSLAEGLSNALLEAMAFEVPVVATRIGGNIDVVEHGVTGLLAEPENPGALAEAMDRLLTDEPLARALAANARCRVLREYTLDGMVDRYLGVYQDLLGARPDG